MYTPSSSHPPHDNESISAALFSGLNILFDDYVSLKIASITDTSVAVVSSPQKADQSLATRPLATTSEPLFKVPAQRGIYSKVESSSNSATLHIGWTKPPLFVNTEYDPTNAFPAIVVL